MRRRNNFSFVRYPADHLYQRVDTGRFGVPLCCERAETPIRSEAWSDTPDRLGEPVSSDETPHAGSFWNAFYPIGMSRNPNVAETLTCDVARTSTRCSGNFDPEQEGNAHTGGR